MVPLWFIVTTLCTLTLRDGGSRTIRTHCFTVLKTWKQPKMQHTYHHQHWSPWKPFWTESRRISPFSVSIMVCFVMSTAHPTMSPACQEFPSVHCPDGNTGPRDRRATVTGKDRKTAPAHHHWHESQEPFCYPRRRWEYSQYIIYHPALSSQEDLLRDFECLTSVRCITESWENPNAASAF